jgi:hypothetical protein
VLKPEPTNPFDKNAIVVTSQAGDTLGYLARGDAVDYADAFAILSAVNGFGLCHAKLIGGTAEKRSYGVLLDLREPADLLEYLAVQIAPLTPRPDSARPF